MQIAKVNGRQNVAATVCIVPLPEAEAQRKAEAEKIRLNATQMQFGPTPLAAAVRHKSTRKVQHGFVSRKRKHDNWGLLLILEIFGGS